MSPIFSLYVYKIKTSLCVKFIIENILSCINIYHNFVWSTSYQALCVNTIISELCNRRGRNKAGGSTTVLFTDGGERAVKQTKRLR